MNKLTQLSSLVKFYLRSKENISPRRKKAGTLLILSIVALSALAGGIVTTGAITRLDITVTNTAASSVINQIRAIPIASSSEIDESATEADMLNSHLHEGSSNIPDMPGTNKINLVAAWEEPQSGGDSNQTVAATPPGSTNDMDLPHLANDEYTFAFHNPARILHLTVGTGYVGSALTITWSYCDVSNATTCTSWVALTGVVDSTNGFVNEGAGTILWTIPTTGDWNKENHKSVGGYWVQAKITNSPASVTTAPKGSDSQYETGQWWMFIDSMTAGQTIDYGLYLGGIDMKTFHHYFPGFEGTVTGDDADLEPGSDWNLNAQLNLNIDTNETGKIAYKEGAFDLNYASAVTAGGANTVTIGVTGAGVGNPFSGVFTHNEEDGGSYYSGTAEESYSKSFYKGSSNYISSRQVDDADVLSNTASEVTSHKIGQAYDTTTNTTPLFGAKIDDPS